MGDAPDLGSGALGACGFESRLPHFSLLFGLLFQNFHQMIEAFLGNYSVNLDSVVVYHADAFYEYVIDKPLAVNVV